LALAACASNYVPKGEPSLYRDLARPGAELDAAAVASVISHYRASNGLSPVSLDPTLMKLAEAQASLMARRNKLSHDVGKPFTTRIKESGFDAKIAAENIGAGYGNIAEAFSGWRESRVHNANMLLKGATRMGIAAVYAPDTRYKVFWSLILAAPDDHRVSDSSEGPPAKLPSSRNL
ncbi:MAG: CAP domain-containing protein, partial [Acidobacteriota bacterium]